jgi:hypothetical protein
VSTREILDEVGAYYASKLAAHGSTPRGVDWNSPESQRLRFQQLLKICDERSGFDIAEPMVAAARARHSGRADCRFVANEDLLEVADYTVASGVFNVKLGFDDRAWERYVLETLERLRHLSRKGIAFNCLTRHSDPERIRSDLYYADPTFLFDHCRTRFSRRVALLHDYPLFEFSVLVRLQGGAA